MARADTIYFVAHGKIGEKIGSTADTRAAIYGGKVFSCTTAGAQDLVQAGMAKLYWSAVNSAYFLRFNKKNNYAMVVALITAYWVGESDPIPT